LLYLYSMNNVTFDTGSAHGFIGSVSFIILAHVSELIGSVDLQTVSYTVAILVGVDTLTGSPIKSTFKKLWEYLRGRIN